LDGAPLQASCNDVNRVAAFKVKTWVNVPRANRVLLLACAILAIIGAVIVVLAFRGDDDRASGVALSATRDDPHDRATGGASRGASTSAGTIENPIASAADDRASGAGTIPLEAMPQLAEAFRSAHFEDAVELCGAPSTLSAHRGDCTIAACRAHLEAKARSWFSTVDEADQARVAKACEDAKVTLGPRERPIRPHRPPRARRGGDVD
jgi:hypothetical protein